jgi:hypothetical protein
MRPPSLGCAARHHSGRNCRIEAEAAAGESESADGSASRSSRGNRYRKPCGMTRSQAHRDMGMRRWKTANNNISGAAGFLRVLGWREKVFGMRGRVFWSGTMGRAEVRGNQQRAARSSGMQKTGQDAREESWELDGSLESCAQSNSSNP